MALAGSVAGDRYAFRRVIQEIIDRTDGVPLFLEELTKAVLEAGATVRRDQNARNVGFVCSRHPSRLANGPP